MALPTLPARGPDDSLTVLTSFPIKIVSSLAMAEGKKRLSLSRKSKKKKNISLDSS